MTAVALQPRQNALTLHFGAALRMNRHEFFQFCRANPDLRLGLDKPLKRFLIRIGTDGPCACPQSVASCQSPPIPPWQCTC